MGCCSNDVSLAFRSGTRDRFRDDGEGACLEWESEPNPRQRTNAQTKLSSAPRSLGARGLPSTKQSSYRERLLRPTEISTQRRPPCTTTMGPQGSQPQQSNGRRSNRLEAITARAFEPACGLGAGHVGNQRGRNAAAVNQRTVTELQRQRPGPSSGSTPAFAIATQ